MVVNVSGFKTIYHDEYRVSEELVFKLSKSTLIVFDHSENGDIWYPEVSLNKEIYIKEIGERYNIDQGTAAKVVNWIYEKII